MRASPDFFAAVLNSLTEHVAVLDDSGGIQWVNDSWKVFYEDNGGDRDQDWRDANYLNVCRSSAEAGDQDGYDARCGIEAVIRGDESLFSIEYPCHSPTEKRWFMMRLRPLELDGPRLFVVTHQNITERKLAELRLEELAAIDGLTGLANRRSFDEFLEDEWRRAQRLSLPLSLVLVDVDHFKPFNDRYGHVAGDDCLRRASKALDAFSRRPGDLVARYGGEEFALILGGTESAAALELAEKARAAVYDLNLPHELAPETKRVTISAGVATWLPGLQEDSSPSDLVEAADRALYEAKEGGRNRVAASRDGNAH